MSLQKIAKLFHERGLSYYADRQQINYKVNKKILIIGGSEGLGFELAKHLAQRDAYVIISSRSQSKGEVALKKLQEEYPRATFQLVIVDICDSSSIGKLVKEIELTHGQLDVVVVNAGVQHQQTGEDAFQKVMNINVYGVIEFSEKSVPIVKEGGRIIIISAELANHCLIMPEYVKWLDGAQSIKDPFFKKVPYVDDSKRFLHSYMLSKAIEARYVQLASKDPLYQSKKIEIVANNPGFNKTALNNYHEHAPLVPSQGSESILWAVATSDNINGGFHSFGIPLDVKEIIPV